jgi:DNA-damage-inducible protein J
MDSTVRARIDSDTKQAATEILSGIGLSVSDAIRLMLINVVNERAFNISVKVPNRETRNAIEELESGRGIRCKNVKEFYRSLNEKG